MDNLTSQSCWPRLTSSLDSENMCPETEFKCLYRHLGKETRADLEGRERRFQGRDILHTFWCAGLGVLQLEENGQKLLLKARKMYREHMLLKKRGL